MSGGSKGPYHKRHIKFYVLEIFIFRSHQCVPVEGEGEKGRERRTDQAYMHTMLCIVVLHNCMHSGLWLLYALDVYVVQALHNTITSSLRVLHDHSASLHFCGVIITQYII